MPTSKKSSKWQFGLKTLILLLVIVGIFLAIVVPRIQNQAKAIALIESLGGTAWFEHDAPKWVEFWRNPDRFRGTLPENSLWIVNLFGQNSVQKLVQAEFGSIDSSSMDDSGTARVAAAFNKVRSLETIRIRTPDIDPAVFRVLAQLRHVKNLFIGQHQVSDVDISQISEMENLAVLHLSYTGVTDQGLSVLKDLNRLQRLTIYSDQITSNGLRPIITIPTLRELTLYNCSLTQEELDQITKNRPQLKANIYFTK